jgi:hypothetical protein
MAVSMAGTKHEHKKRLMQPSPKRQDEASGVNALDSAAEEAIAEHGGDARETVKALLEKIAFLEEARDRALDLVSFGYARGKVHGGS